MGTKTGTVDAGPFDRTMEFSRGVTMVAGPNFTGKTSVLEILTWCLRGRQRNLQVDVARWLEHVECDITVNQHEHRIVLDLQDGALVLGRLSAIEPRTDGEQHSAAERSLFEVSTAEDWAEKITAFMLDRLDLTPLTVRTKTGDIQEHSWPSYYGAIYPAAGGERVLIGDTVQAALAGRLLTIFLDLPNSALLPRVAAARDRTKHDWDVQRAEERAREQNAASARARYGQVVADTQAALRELTAETSAPSATEVALDVARLSSEMADHEQMRRVALDAAEQASSARQSDQRRLNDYVESAAARVLFHGLDPVSCPRCEAPVTDDRRRAETATHVCAVCVTPITDGEDAPSREEVTAELRGTVQAALQAEEIAREELDAVSIAARRIAEQLEVRERELRDARQSREATELNRLERVLARAEGAMEALTTDEAPPNDADENRLAEDLAILQALHEEIRNDLVAASASVFEPLQDEVVSLAQRFGIPMVSAVIINRAARMDITKGGASSPFSKQSPGERLRLRIGIIVALLRVGARLHLATHPGLLMIDSLRAEEVDDDDARALLDELVAVAGETPGLQLITTSTDTALALDVLPERSVITPGPGRETVW